jgi:hypothetical protein
MADCVIGQGYVEKLSKTIIVQHFVRLYYKEKCNSRQETKITLSFFLIFFSHSIGFKMKLTQISPIQ